MITPDSDFSHQLKSFIDLALAEDIGTGDHSSNASIPSGQRNRARLLVKENGILCGIDVAEYIFTQYASHAEFEQLIPEGTAVAVGDIAFTIEAYTRDILRLERLVLNIMQRLSGIATKTSELREKISHTSCRLLDTRKTTPGMRFLEKYAVRVGGGTNHRIGLYDMIMLKDNHVDAAGGIRPAIMATHHYLREMGLSLKIEVETRNLGEVRQVMEIGGIDRIMLDNFSPELIRDALLIIHGSFETEASGGITESNIVSYAETGVDFISTSQITHSVKSMDLSLKIIR